MCLQPYFVLYLVRLSKIWDSYFLRVFGTNYHWSSRDQKANNLIYCYSKQQRMNIKPLMCGCINIPTDANVFWVCVSVWTQINVCWLVCHVWPARALMREHSNSLELVHSVSQNPEPSGRLLLLSWRWASALSRSGEALAIAPNTLKHPNKCRSHWHRRNTETQV